MWRRVRSSFLFSLAFLSVFGVAQSADAVLGPCWVVKVEDGDSIAVRLPTEEILGIRYLGIYAPEPADEAALGVPVTTRHAELVHGTHVWLEVGLQDGAYLRDRDDRGLAFVFLDEERTKLVQEILVQEGLAVHHVTGLVDERLDDFALHLRYSERLIESQIEAVLARRGVWQLPEMWADRDLAVAAVKFWGRTEVVYIVNRGDSAIDVGQPWALMDRAAYDRWLEGGKPLNRLEFSAVLGPTCLLEPGGVLEVRTGPGVPAPERNTRIGCGSLRVVLNWFGRKVWGNDGDHVVLVSPDRSLWCRFSYPEPWKSRL
jgi:endonuclease YncB( thermonuclease family)